MSSDLTSTLLKRLQDYRLPGFDLGEEFIYPNYDGQSILNIPSGICRLLDTPEFGAPALIPDILYPLGEGVRRVVFVLVDALALHRLQRWMAEGAVPVWERLQRNGILAPLTSITPSTTSAALTSLWTGRPPAQHGIAGYELWLKEYGIVANMIFHNPISYRGMSGGLSNAGFEPESFLSVPTLGPHLTAHGIAVHAFQHYAIANSGLSRMFFPEVDLHTFASPSDLWVSVRQLLESQPDQSMFTWVYWGQVDGLSHFHGPDDERPAAEFASFSAAFERLFLERLDSAARKDTVVILAADHGQITTHKDAHYEVSNHPNLARRLHMLPTGENRLPYLHVRPGQIEAVREYIQKTWANQFHVVNSSFALQAGLFGDGEALPQMPDRLGDLMLIPRENYYLWWAAKENPLIGRHGGLHPEEMLVPFLAARL